MKYNLKKMSLLFLSTILCIQFMAYHMVSAVAKEITSDNSNGYTVEKISHANRGAGEIDGILTGDDEDRGQSYSWAMEEYGDYLYIGTCYNPIYGIFYRNLMGNLKDTFQDKTEIIVKGVIDILYNGNFYDNQKSNPAIIKVNKKTGESNVLYRYGDANPTSTNNMSGFRMAAVYKDKLYFVGSGYPTSIVLEIDPVTGASREVYSRTVKNYAIASGIHGLVVYNDQLLMSITEETEAEPSAKIYSSINPSKGEWEEIANSRTFKNYPAVMIKDGINGGGIWELCEFNNELYVTMITDRGEDIKNKKGFAMFKGTENGDNWSWKEIIGDTDSGAAYPFGLSMNASTTANLYSYDGYLYIGNYNDPMLDLAEVVKGDFKPLYNDLKQSINLYRMDKNGKIELVAGQANETFPDGPVGNLGAGLGSHMNQYVWRMEQYDGKLYVGTFDTSTITNAFTQLTNGEFIENNLMDKESFFKLLDNVYDILSAILKGRTVIDDTDRADINQMLNNLVGIEEQINGTSTRSAIRKDVVDEYTSFLGKYNSVKKWLPVTITTQIEKLLPIIEQNVYYYGINTFCKTAVKGFDLLVTDDGINFDTITRTGFDDPNNHGMRTMKATAEGLFLGTANPFWGTQLWKLKNIYENPVITPTQFSFYKNGATDFIMNVDSKGNNFQSISLGDTVLVKNRDYTLNSNTITLKKEYLNTLNYRDTAYTYTIAFNHEKTVSVNVQVMIKPQVEKYTVSFDTQGGNLIKPIKDIKKDSLITKPADPIREGYTFEGWFKDITYLEAWDFEADKLTSNLTLFAKWKPITYKITYILNGGTLANGTLSSYTIENEVSISNPTRANYTFAGWYTDAECTQAVNSKIVKGTIGDKIWYAKWTKNQIVKPIFDQKPNTYTESTNTAAIIPDTADHINQMLYLELLLGASLILGGITVYNKK